MTVEWLKRCRKDETLCAHRRTWSSICGRYRIEESDIKYGRGVNKRGEPVGYPIYYRVLIHMPWGWWIISTHRKRSAAMKQVEYFHEHGTPIPKKKKRRKKLVRDVSDQAKERYS